PAPTEIYALSLHDALPICPEEVHLNRAVIYSDCLRQSEAAERELREALRLNASYVPALLNLANLHEDRGQRDEARLFYERALTLDRKSTRLNSSHVESSYA